MRVPTPEDGGAIWQLVKDSGTLDLNSPYCYLMLCRYFSASCALAEVLTDPSDSSGPRELAGFATCLPDPQQPQRLFVWQVGVAANQRGKGLASRLLLEILERPVNQGLRYLEATIGPSNQASQALFRSLARRYATQIQRSEGFPPSLFPGAGHEAEDLYVIGPFTPGSSNSR